MVPAPPQLATALAKEAVFNDHRVKFTTHTALLESVKSTLKGSEIIETSTDSCQHNKWRGCYSQTNKEDCEDEYERDCQWFEGTNIRKSWEKIYEVEQEDDGVCFPKYSPGFDFWSEGEDTGNLCNYASDQCTITYERNLIAGGLFDTKWNIKKNGRCEPGGDWEEERQQLCLAVGDCGVKTNYISTYGNTFWGELFSGKTEDGTYNKAHFGETARSRNANPPDDGRDEELEDLYDQQSDSDEGYGP